MLPVPHREHGFCPSPAEASLYGRESTIAPDTRNRHHHTPYEDMSRGRIRRGRADMKIEELTKKIYSEGIDKAKKLEQEAVEKAQAEADRILSEARKRADELTSEAEQKAKSAKEALDRELKQAGELALAQIKRQVADCLVDALLPESVETAMQDSAFMQKLILQIAENWNPGTNVDVEIVLSAAGQQELSDQFNARAKQLLDRGLELKFSDQLSSGFRIQPKDGGYRISFEEESFVAFFREFLRERTRAALFPTDGKPGTEA